MYKELNWIIESEMTKHLFGSMFMYLTIRQLPCLFVTKPIGLKRKLDMDRHVHIILPYLTFFMAFLVLSDI